MPNYVAHCLVIIGALCCTMVGTFFPLFLNGSADWQRPDKQRHWDARVSGAADHGCTLQAMGGKSRLGDIRVRVECNIFAKSVLVGRILIADHSMGDGRGSRSSNSVTSPRVSRESPAFSPTSYQSRMVSMDELCTEAASADARTAHSKASAGNWLLR